MGKLYLLPYHYVGCVAGTAGRTPYLKLRRPVKSSLGRGDRTTFVLRERPVGVLRYVQLYNDGGKPGAAAADADWFVSYIVLSTPYNNHCYTLPCYRWLAGRSLLSLRDGTGEKTCLPGARFTKYLTTVLRLSYDNAKVTINLRRTSNLQNILQ